MEGLGRARQINSIRKPQKMQSRGRDRRDQGTTLLRAVFAGPSVLGHLGGPHGERRKLAVQLVRTRVGTAGSPAGARGLLLGRAGAAAAERWCSSNGGGGGARAVRLHHISSPSSDRLKQQQAAEKGPVRVRRMQRQAAEKGPVRLRRMQQQAAQKGPVRLRRISSPSSSPAWGSGGAAAVVMISMRRVTFCCLSCSTCGHREGGTRGRGCEGTCCRQESRAGCTHLCVQIHERLLKLKHQCCWAGGTPSGDGAGQWQHAPAGRAALATRARDAARAPPTGQCPSCRLGHTCCSRVAVYSWRFARDRAALSRFLICRAGAGCSDVEAGRRAARPNV